MKSHAIHRCGHTMLANTPVDVISAIVFGAEVRVLVFDFCVVRTG